MNWDRPPADRIHVAYWFTVLVYLSFHVMVFETDVYVAFVVIYSCCCCFCFSFFFFSSFFFLFFGGGGIISFYLIKMVSV